MTGRVIALDRNEYYCPHHPDVLAALRMAADSACNYATTQSHIDLRKKIAELTDVPPDLITLGHGGEDLLIKILVWQRRFASKLVRLDFSWQTYTEIAQGLDFDVVSVPVQEINHQFITPLDRFDTLLASLRDRAVVILNTPNNPTGHTLDSEKVFELAHKHPQHVFILDGVYDVPRSKHIHSATALSNVVFVGSFSKFFGLPGMRIGYAIASELPRAFQPILGLPPSAIAACGAAIKHHDHYMHNRHLMLAFAAEMTKLHKSSVQIFRSDAPFVLSRLIQDSSASYERISELSETFLVKPKVFSQGNDTYLRWGIATQEINERILKFMQNI